ncbi:hypothetical protein D7D52_17025 [Nocardia yunnanensis]|uniref:Uncharacterized protein n=1 Tax=Nocardia yunnanensis TaxID=2382165 RepID=A0A386ZBQ7_9NOCA|nr:hypothetical protein [Nocardia yunnanensis]AYF75292.1 hypothetical protein D7D52_17025 [Nocardia yunnanensis]
MTPPLMYAYVRLALTITTPAREAVEDIEELALRYGGSVLGRVYYEKGSPVPVLLSLLAGIDKELDGEVFPLLRTSAADHRLDLQQLLDAPPPTPALWSLLDAIAAGGEAEVYVFVPSPEHFDGLGVPRQTVLQRIYEIAPRVNVLYLDRYVDAADHRPGRRLPGGSTPPHRKHGVLLERALNQVPAAPQIACSIANEKLSRAGLRELVGPVSAALTELVGDFIATRPGEANQMQLRIECRPGTDRLALEVWETRGRERGAVSATVAAIVEPVGGSVARWPSTAGGTITRCEFPLPGSDSHDPAVPSPLAEAARSLMSARRAV